MYLNTKLLLILFQRYILLNIFIYGNIFSIKFIINDNKSASIISCCLLYLFFIIYLIFEYIIITKIESTDFFKDIITQVIILLILLKSDLSINMKINIFLLIHNFLELFLNLIKKSVFINLNIYYNYIFFGHYAPIILLFIKIANFISVIQNIIFINYNIFQNYNIAYNLLYFILPLCNFIFVYTIYILYNSISHYYYIIIFLYFTKNNINTNNNINYNSVNNILIEIKSNINEDKVILLKQNINCFYCNKPNNRIYEINQMSGKCLKCKKNNICMYFIDCDHHVACFDCCINV